MDIKVNRKALKLGIEYVKMLSTKAVNFYGSYD